MESETETSHQVDEMQVAAVALRRESSVVTCSAMRNGTKRRANLMHRSLTANRLPNDTFCWFTPQSVSRGLRKDRSALISISAATDDSFKIAERDLQSPL